MTESSSDNKGISTINKIKDFIFWFLRIAWLQPTLRILLIIFCIAFLSLLVINLFSADDLLSVFASNDWVQKTIGPANFYLSILLSILTLGFISVYFQLFYELKNKIDKQQIEVETRMKIKEQLYDEKIKKIELLNVEISNTNLQIQNTNKELRDTNNLLLISSKTQLLEELNLLIGDINDVYYTGSFKEEFFNIIKEKINYLQNIQIYETDIQQSSVLEKFIDFSLKTTNFSYRYYPQKQKLGFFTFVKKLPFRNYTYLIIFFDGNDKDKWNGIRITGHDFVKCYTDLTKDSCTISLPEEVETIQNIISLKNEIWEILKNHGAFVHRKLDNSEILPKNLEYFGKVAKTYFNNEKFEELKLVWVYHTSWDKFLSSVTHDTGLIIDSWFDSLNNSNKKVTRYLLLDKKRLKDDEDYKTNFASHKKKYLNPNNPNYSIIYVDRNSLLQQDREIDDSAIFYLKDKKIVQFSRTDHVGQTVDFFFNGNLEKINYYESYYTRLGSADQIHDINSLIN